MTDKHRGVISLSPDETVPHEDGLDRAEAEHGSDKKSLDAMEVFASLRAHSL